MQGAATKHAIRLHERIWRSCTTIALRRQEGLGSAHREAQALAGFLPTQVSILCAQHDCDCIAFHNFTMTYDLVQIVTHSCNCSWWELGAIIPPSGYGDQVSITNWGRCSDVTRPGIGL